MLLTAGYKDFVENSQDFFSYMNDPQCLVIASPGRSGSTLLVKCIAKSAEDRLVLKTHQFVPKEFQGKVLFIFSQPDRAAESALHKLLEDKDFGQLHFDHLFTSDKEWLSEIGYDTRKQSLRHNLLAYDALGTGEHLQKWLLDWVAPASKETAQILAIKYEHLWDAETQEAIRTFCHLDHFELPPKKERGCEEKKMSPLELLLRRVNNEERKDEPEYKAYDHARELWKKAPPFQFLSQK
ncbi:MAG TPA: hypothetical protein DCE71_08670 [Parachlamydiales bacterium]|nr:hypothetical protein [Parachlamydiales bacterium]